MKKIIFYSIIFLFCTTYYSCNDEWKDEQYQKYVSFVNSGYTNVYLKYDREGGFVPYKIPVIVSGSTFNDRNVQVTIGIDPDTLAAMNIARFNDRQDLFFKQLAIDHYQFESMQTTIPAGSEVGYININFKVQDLDLVDKYILPLNIETTSEYMPSPKKWYKKSLMRIIPFNDYSGSYSATAGNVYEGSSATPMTMDEREARVVNENTIFFYAGVVEESARDRANYKIRATFNDDYTITLAADYKDIIDFKYTAADCKYTIDTRMDELQPYLQIRTITMTLKYQYNDVTIPAYPITYRFEGSYTLERRRNTQIPEENQQEVFD